MSELFVAPVGTPPDGDGWTRVGTATSAGFVPLTGDDVCQAMGVDADALRQLAFGGVRITASFELAKAEFRRVRAILLGMRRCWGPPPLATGALAASTLARKRGGRRRG